MRQRPVCPLRVAAYAQLIAPVPGDTYFSQPEAALKTLTTRNGSFTTEDGIADAVMSYGLALSRRHDVDIVNVPFTADDGSVRRVELLVGWHIDLTSTSTAEVSGSPRQEDTMDSLDLKTASLGNVQARAFSAEDEIAWSAFDLQDF